MIDVLEKDPKVFAAKFDDDKTIELHGVDVPTEMFTTVRCMVVHLWKVSPSSEPAEKAKKRAVHAAIEAVEIMKRGWPKEPKKRRRKS